MRDGNLGRVGGVGDPHQLDAIMGSPDSLDVTMMHGLKVGTPPAPAAAQPYTAPEFQWRKPQLSSLVYAEKVGMLILIAFAALHLLDRTFTHGPRAASRDALAGVGMGGK